MIFTTALWFFNSNPGPGLIEPIQFGVIAQDELAAKIGVRRETIVFLEKGKYNPSLKLAHDIAMVFGLTIEEVFIFTE